MARRKRRLTLSKPKTKSKSNEVLLVPNLFEDNDCDPEDPKPRDWDEWNVMEPRAYFKMDGCMFHKGDSAIINSGDGDTNVWLAQILSIRSRRGAKMPWILVRWYYSLHDLRLEFGKEIGCESIELSAKERVFSDRMDILSHRVFENVIAIPEWDEADCDPPFISPDHFFIRYGLSWSKVEWEVAPGASTCLFTCGEPYNPFLPQEILNISRLALKAHKGNEAPKGPPLQADTMHFCSGPTCRRWYHRACLLHKSAYVEDPTLHVRGSRPIRRLAHDAEQDPNDVVYGLRKFLCPQLWSESLRDLDLSTMPLVSVLEAECGVRVELPESVLRVAVMPILRRPDLPHPHNLAGNMREVLLAQQMVHQELEYNRDSLNAYIEAVFDDYQGPLWIMEPRMRHEVTDFLGKQRMVASPLERYWDEQEKTFNDWFGIGTEIPLLSCPACGGAI